MTAHTIIITPGRADKLYWHDLWRYRELFLVLAWRDITVRYKQTFIGLAWTLLQPLATMLVFTIIFGRLALLPTEGSAPYSILVFAGLLPWQLFSTAMNGAAVSLISNANLISKVYFPRLLVPAAAVVVAFVDFIVSFAILLCLMLWHQYPPSWHILFLPIFILMGFLASLGIGLWITALNVKYRDFRYVVPFLLQLGLYISPVGFSSTIVSDEWRILYSLNPLVGVIDGFRWAILGHTSKPYLPGLLLSWIVIVFFLWLGVRQFLKMEKTFADLI